MMKSINELIDLKGRTAIVTGGTGWLGAPMCEALSELGCNVFAVSRGKSTSFTTHINVSNFHTVIADITADPMSSIVDVVLNRTGRIDILINNSHEWSKELDFENLTVDGATRAATDGFVGPLMLTQAVYGVMKAQGGGSIINVASMLGHVAPNHAIYRDTPGMGNAIQYGAMKAAMLQATRYIASIGGKHGIRCNSISPGPFSRPGSFDNDRGWFEEELQKKTMLGRVGRPEELKGVIAFLASDMSSYVTGADIAVDAGWRAW